jgi:gas vesicle protein
MSEHEDQEEKGLGGFGWFIAGVVVGACAAILYAPKSGKETRGFLTEKAHAGKEVVSETSKDVFSAGKEMYEKGQQLVEDAAALFERGRKLVRG